MKGNGVKIVIAVVLLLVAVFIILKTSTNVFDSAPSLSEDIPADQYVPGRKPKVE